jgi:hypothetical protein
MVREPISKGEAAMRPKGILLTLVTLFALFLSSLRPVPRPMYRC